MSLFRSGKGRTSKESDHDVIGEYPVRNALQRAIDENCLLAVVVDEARFARRARIVGIEERDKFFFVLRFYENVDFSPGATIEATFESPEWRYSFTTSIEEIRDDTWHLCALPEVLRDAERRASLRVKLRRGENVRVAAISDPQSGVAVSGVMLQFSTSGFVFCPQSVAEAKSQEALLVGREHFRVGAEYPTVRFKLPGAERDTVVSAVVRRVVGTAPELNVAMEFQELRDADHRIVEELVEMRAARLPVTGPLFADERFQAEGEREKTSQGQKSPATAPTRTHPVQAPEDATETASHVVLLVGDPLNTCPDGRQTLRSQNPVTFQEVADAKTALLFVAEQPCHVILVRVIHSDPQSLALLKLLRNHPALTNIPIIAVTPPPSPVEIVRLRSNGVTDIIHEPVDANLLAEKIGKWIEAGRT